MSAIAFDQGGAPRKSVPEFTKARYRTMGQLVFLRVGDVDKPVGVLIEQQGSLTFACRRTERHLLRLPRKAWAFSVALLDVLENTGVAWLRVERHDLPEPAGWVAALPWLRETPSFEGK